ncbi:hypothetical protein ACSBR2_025331 [Camellia fascicularis]
MEVNGGWRLVLRKHGGQGFRNNAMENEIHTIFVDNLLDSMNPKGLYEVFTNFGIVRDVFIPNKRRKMTRSRFSFVRYACPVAANMAVQKAHAILCDNRALKVKEIDFVQGKEEKERPLNVPGRRRDIGSTSRVPNMSYAQALSGRGLVTSASITLNAFEEENGWLYDNVIIRLKPPNSTVEFKKELKTRGMRDIQVRDGGGRDIVLTFE